MIVSHFPILFSWLTQLFQSNRSKSSRCKTETLILLQVVQANIKLTTVSVFWSVNNKKKNAKKSHLHVKLFLGKKPQHKQTEVWLIAPAMAAFHLYSAELWRSVAFQCNTAMIPVISHTCSFLSRLDTHSAGPGSKPHTLDYLQVCVGVCPAQHWWPVRSDFFCPWLTTDMIF